MEMTKNALNWFEVPVADFDRAKKFYSAIFAFEMPEIQMGPNRLGFFLHEQGQGVGGAIVQGSGYTPSTEGALIYLAAGKDLSVVLGRVEAAGGKVLQPKREVAPHLGYFALFRDSEGNRLALHSMG